MTLVKRILSAIKEKRYLSSLHPENRERVEQAAHTMVESHGEFRVLKRDIQVDGIQTPRDALHTIFDLSLQSHVVNEKGDEGILSPLGVAMHINTATTPTEAEYVH